MHIIEELIAERAQKLMSKPRLWRALNPGLYKALGYAKAVELADQITDLSGHDAFELVSQDMQTAPIIRGADHIPRKGAVMIISNHPTGLADGIFVYEALKSVRPDHIFMANADALRVIPLGEDIIIPVEWVKEKRSPAKTRETLRAMKTAFRTEKAVVIFPSGVLAKLSWRGLTDKDWNTTAVSMAKKHNIPIVPLRIQARNSLLYYLFSVLNTELRDITLFRELINKAGTSPKLTFGPAIDPANLPRDVDTANAKIRAVVETL